MSTGVVSGRSALRRVVIWAALVVGCALPMLVDTWNHVDAGGRVAGFAGVAAWILAMAIDETRLHWMSSSSRDSSWLMAGAAAFVALEWVGTALYSELFLFLLYSPSVILASRLFRPVFSGSGESDFGPVLVLTLICGAQTLCCVLALRFLATRLWPRRSA